MNFNSSQSSGKFANQLPYGQ